MVFKNRGAVGSPFTTPFKINNNDNDNNNNDDESRCSNSITFSNAHHLKYYNQLKLRRKGNMNERLPQRQHCN